MSSYGNAFNAKKGRAVASFFGKVNNKFDLSRKFNLSPQFRFSTVWKVISAFALALMFSKLAHASGTDLLSSQNTTVNATFGADSSMVKWFYIAEILIGLFTFIKVRSPLVFAGIVVAIIATKVGFSIAG
jgi:type IV conjugative transfer system pilin TraA